MNFKKNNSGPEQSFQIAPMIDVIFLLLTFFVASQIFSQWETEIDITLPTAQTSEQPDRIPGEIIINIRGDGAVVVNQLEMDEAALDGLLNRIVEQFSDWAVLIRADKETRYADVIDVLDACRRADIWNVSFATTIEDGNEQ
ncbi:MAG: biopolymer transporter ExbD [Kiritimatiellia bacterium]|jgi:biopolymer transport protein ExbD|nr:biopolymer transporter ExbD [Kiritimatiellia bacterium]MDP6630829.1 biopolymer transporter ExbD [Kiritimatiellia bacterium]MDP6811292.1 biopolymer transporter ExbD [Kiritimatiellia bacterium]MDP7024094.1 biopolymer transporter ExbD [Kiritimatiellia bacterium]